MTFVATASCAAMLGAKVVFADVEEDTALIDPAAVDAVVDRPDQSHRRGGLCRPAADYAALQPIADRVGARHARRRGALGRRTLRRPAGRRSGRCDDAVVLPDEEPHHRRGWRGGREGPGGRAAGARVPLHRAGPGSGPVRDHRRGAVAPGGARVRRELPADRRRVRAWLVAAAPAARRSSRGGRRSPRGTTRPWPASTASVRRCSAPASILPGTCTRCGCSAVAGARSFEGMRAAGIGVQVNYIPVYWHPVFARQGYQRGLCPNAEAFYARGTLAADVPRTSPTPTSTG